MGWIPTIRTLSKGHTGRICCETRSPIILIMDKTDNIITIYVGDKMVKVVKEEIVIRPSNCPQYY